MKSIKEMSALIRAKKKSLEEDPDVVSLSGIPMDATDIDIDKRNEQTEELDENMPESAAPSPHASNLEGPVSEESAEAEMSEEEKAQRAKRMDRLSKMLGV